MKEINEFSDMKQKIANNNQGGNENITYKKVNI